VFLILLSIYLTVTINKLSNSEANHHQEIEATGLLLYLYLSSCLFLIFFLVRLTRTSLVSSKELSRYHLIQCQSPQKVFFFFSFFLVMIVQYWTETL